MFLQRKWEPFAGMLKILCPGSSFELAIQSYPYSS